MNTTTSSSRKDYFEVVEPKDWSLVNFLSWRTNFSDFSSKYVEHSAWKSLLKNLTNTSLYRDSTVNKAQELLSDFESAKNSYDVKKFWEEYRSMYLDDRLKTISKEIKLQIAVSDLKYVINKSEEETIHSDLIGRRRYQILENELESKREDTSEPTKKPLTQQKRHQTRYGRNIPDYSGQEFDPEYEPKKRVRITQPDLRSHDKPKIDAGKFEENYNEETELFFELSDILTIQELITESIANTTEELVVKLLRWQQNNLKQLYHGIHRPEEQNINKLLSVSSIFYFRKQNEQSYLDFLTADDISKIQSDVISKFVKITTPHELISFVDENKRKFQRDAQEEIIKSIKLSAVNQKGSLLNETFFKLLKECATWNPSIDVNKMNEGTYIVDRIGPLFNKTIHYFNYVTIHSWFDTVSEVSKLRRGRGRVPDYMLKNRDETCVGVFCEVTSPKRQDEEHKVYWDIYRGSIHAKDSIDFDIKQLDMHPDETNQIVIFINGHKMEVCVMTLYYPGIYLLVEVESCTIPKTVRDLRSLMKLHQILMSIRENAIDLLGERSRTTPLQTNYSKWLRPTADTPSARTEN